MTENRIEHETTIAAPVDVVWQAVTRPEHLGTWFGNGQPTRVDLRPGGRIVFDHVGHGDIPAVIEAVDEPRLLSYRWAVVGPPGEEPTGDNSTLVELSLTGAGNTTSVRLLETGFTDVEAPAPELDARYEANARGWPRILDGLRTHAESLVRR